MLRLLKSTFFALFIFSLLFSFANAQGIPGVEEPLFIEMSPRQPKPGSTITLDARSYVTDLDQVNINWYVGGKLYKKGIGATSITITAGKGGSSTNVSVEATVATLGYLKNNIVIRPGDVTLLWESDGYTPPFYKGKASESYGASFRITAIPDLYTSSGKRINPKTVIYTWRKNGEVEPTDSGYGKETYSGSQTSFVRGGDDISVEVSSPTDDVSASRTITISPTVPEMTLYENSPLYGVIYEKSLQDWVSMRSEELTLRVEPFGISVTNPETGPLTYSWTLNSVPLFDFENKRDIVFRRGLISGQSVVEVNSQHTEKILQGGGIGITIYQ